MPISGCVVQKTSGNVSLSDFGCRIVFKNPAKLNVMKIKVDGCLPIAGLKCDYSIVFDEKNAFILVELKGSNVSHAIKQIENTIKWFFQNTEYSLHRCFVIVSGRSPRETAHFSNKKEKFAKKYNVLLKIVRSGTSLNLI